MTKVYAGKASHEEISTSAMGQPGAVRMSFTKSSASPKVFARSMWQKTDGVASLFMSAKAWPTGWGPVLYRLPATFS